MNDARDIAALVLKRVWLDEAYATRALDAELTRRANLDRRDAALATELVYGVLRTQLDLETRIDEFASNRRYKKQPALKAPLLIGAYSLLYLERVPPYAAIDSAVDAIKRARGERVGGFANAVLRKVAKLGRADVEEAILRSVPPWLRKQLQASVDDVDALLRAGGIPAAGLCLTQGEDRDAWLSTLRAAAPDATIEAGTLSPRAITVRGAGKLTDLPGHDQAWRVQEEGAQLIALAVGAKQGERVLDACAGRGSKTRILAEQIGADAVVATDLHPRKFAALDGIERHPVDWTKGCGEVIGPFDRILVDAPCTGTGTLRRRPEIATRLKASDVERLSQLQLSIAGNASRLLRPGGTLLFAVCSVLTQEGEQVVEALCRDFPLDPCRFEDDAVRAVADGSSLRLLPHVHGTDGYFLAALRAR